MTYTLALSGGQTGNSIHHVQINAETLLTVVRNTSIYVQIHHGLIFMSRYHPTADKIEFFIPPAPSVRLIPSASFFFNTIKQKA
ncbi:MULTISPECIES: hypothetical protein [Yersinia pseudotuberculosis complex]|nr:MULTISPECIES: hypothetical protein [Yersinia pseudotuberculosis complex]AJI90895.1 hypothetical protein CH59_2708 [Yersinia pestis]AJI97783.1 hypothetical protein BZ18_1313 [Yersinia pestis Pestoides F]AJJ16884.1 hypothetical protein CH46_1754 [Yersinia pestis]AJJ31244.1 hypothetical protein CH61_808 [Yersinia pestis]AJJ41151.1 hypothetical protein CH62_1255 [Yersinia pestis]